VRKLIEARPIEEGTKPEVIEGTKPAKVIEPKVMDHSLPPSRFRKRF
jgi:hypothetical protein